MYKIGDYVVYGKNGVCRVDEIGPLKMDGIAKDRNYYYLSPVYMDGSKVFTPVDGNKVVLRPIFSKAEADSLIEDIKDIERIEMIEVANEKNRENIYKEMTRSCDCHELLKVIKTISMRKKERLEQGKRLMVCDEKYFRIATEHLSGELAVSLSISKEEVETLISKSIG